MHHARYPRDLDDVVGKDVFRTRLNRLLRTKHNNNVRSCQRRFFFFFIIIFADFVYGKIIKNLEGDRYTKTSTQDL